MLSIQMLNKNNKYPVFITNVDHNVGFEGLVINVFTIFLSLTYTLYFECIFIE